MKRAMVILTAGLLAFGAPALADIVQEEGPDEGVGGVTLNPVRAGRLEIVPIMSMRFSGSTLVYQAGVSVGYSLSRMHQVGGSFVMGNRAYNRRANRREVLATPPGTVRNATGNALSIDDGFGSSLTGFYRLNIPIQVEKRTFPFVEAFGGRDFWGWGNVSELGGGVGVRKVLSDRTALTSQYSYVALFANGQRLNRHIVTAGVSMFFR